MGIFDTLASPFRRAFGTSQRGTLPALSAAEVVDATTVERFLERAERNAGRSLAESVVTNVSQGGPRKGSNEIFKLYRESPWLRATSHHVSSTVGAVAWKLFAEPTEGTRHATRKAYREPSRELLIAPPTARHALRKRALGDGSLVEITRHPWLTLMDRPNALMRGKVARQSTIASYDLVGTAGWVIERGPQDVPVRGYPVPGTWIQRRPTFEEPTWGINIGGVQWNIPVTDFLSFEDPDPAQPYGPGAGLGLAIADELDIDEHAAKTVGAYFQNGAMPNSIVSMKGARPDVLKRAKSDWNNLLQGFRKAYKTHFVSTELSVERMDTSFKDMALIEIRKSVRDTIQQTWGVPPEKLGIVTNSNRATSQAARAIDAEDVMVPRLEVLREEFQRLASMFDDRLVVDYEDPVPADIEVKRGVYSAFAGRFTVDEERALAGDPPLPEGHGGNGFIVNGIWYPRLTDLRPDIRADHIAAGIPSVNEARDRLRLPPRSDGYVPTSSMPMLAPAPEPAPAPEVPAAEDAPQTAADLLMNTTAQKRSVPLDAIKRIVNEVSVRAMYDQMGPVIGRLIDAWGQETLNVVGDLVEQDAGTFDGDSASVRGHMRALATERIQKLINTTTREEVRAAIEQVNRDGGEVDDYVSAIGKVFERARVVRSQVIAETESIVHSQYAGVEALKQSGITMKKEWIATQDGRTRDAHLSLDGQRRELDEAFSVPSGQYQGAKAQQPGGFRIGALDINCRCVVGSVIEDSELAAKLATRGVSGVALLTPNSTAEQRAAAWSAADETLRPWDSRIAKAARDGFDAQEVAVLAALTDALA